MKIGKILSIILIVCVVSPLLTASSGGPAEAAAQGPVSNAEMNAANAADYESSQNYTTNTILLPQNYSDVRFNSVPTTEIDRCEYRSDMDKPDSAFEHVLISLTSSYGNPYSLSHQEKSGTASAQWMTEDGEFVIHLSICNHNDRRYLRLIILKWPEWMQYPTESHSKIDP